MVNNASLFENDKIENFTTNSWERHLRTNLRAPALLSKEFAKNMAMHIAATNPVGISPEEVPQTIIEREKDIYRAQAREIGKPEKMIDKIAEGKLNKFYKDSCLLLQPYVRDPSVSIQDVLNDLIVKIGENITIKRFSRLQIGEL